jgi:protein-disulfide isomerase-like protein with CxxC motif
MLLKRNVLLATYQDKLAERKKAAKDRAKAAKAAYLARPDVQKRLAEQKAKRKEMAAAQRKKLADQRKAKRKNETSALKEAISLTRQKRQNAKDQALASSITLANALGGDDSPKSKKPSLTVIQGGLSQKQNS